MGKDLALKCAARDGPNLDHRCIRLQKLAASGIMRPMKYWELIADKLSAART
jgi:hypothetical protein